MKAPQQKDQIESELLDEQADEQAIAEEQHFTFVLSSEEFALPIQKIKEIISYSELTYVPLVPSFIRGAINLRGTVVPVIDLADKFSMPSSETTRWTCIVIVEVEINAEIVEMGLIVDKVLQVLNISAREIKAVPDFGTKIRTDFMRGMGKVGEKFIIILDIDRILSIEEIAAISSTRHGDEADES